jgi:hypothetical protein
MPDLIDAAVTVEGRLVHAERTLTDVRVAVARVETRLAAHETSVADFRKENSDQYVDLKTQMTAQMGNITRQLEPLREARWKFSGGMTVVAAFVSAAISLALKFFWK